MCSRSGTKTAETLHQRPGIDIHWTCSGTESVDGAGIERHVREFTIQRVPQRRATSLLLPGHLAAHDDALAGRESQIPARALGLAVAALNALSIPARRTECA